MANELVHASQGTELYQNEFESVTAHVLNSQATGDMIYASSATQLSRLAIGSNNALLGISAGIPAWITNPLPVADNSYDLGLSSSSLFWRWLYICGALTGASGGVDFGRWAKISREGDDNLSIFTKTAGSAFAERIRFGSGAAQGLAGITLYEPLVLKTGAAAAGSAPLKFVSGILLTTPEAGVLEFVTDTLSFTITTGAARKTLAFLESPSFTTPVIGAATGVSLALSSFLSVDPNVDAISAQIAILNSAGGFGGSKLQNITWGGRVFGTDVGGALGLFYNAGDGTDDFVFHSQFNGGWQLTTEITFVIKGNKKVALGGQPYATQPVSSIGLPGGLMIGANSLNNMIDDASNGSGSTAMYVGNKAILVANGVNFGPAAVASITVVNGQITAIS